MGDAIDRMYEVSLFGYAFGEHFYPFFKSGIAMYLILPIIVLSFVFYMRSALFEEDGSVAINVIKWFVGSILVLVSLYNPVSFSLGEKADLSGSQLGVKYLDTKKALFGTDRGSMPWLAHKVDQYMTGWIQFAAELADRRNRFIFPGSAQSAVENFSKSDSLEDPQVRSILSQWQQIIVPYLLQNVSLKQKLQEQDLISVFTFPVTSSSDVMDPEGVADKARKVVEILKSETTLDLVSATRNLSAMLHDPQVRLNGAAMSIDANETAVLAPMLGPYTLNAPMAPATAPGSYPESAIKAYNKGYSVLTSIANDSRRLPLQSYDNFGDLYMHIGYAADMALARRQLQQADSVEAFGITCLNHGELYCKQALVSAPTAMQRTSDGFDFTNKTLRFMTGTVGAVTGAIDSTLLDFAKVKIPMYIGIAKGIVTIATPVFMIFMLWPGRFAMGLTYILGGYVLVGLWMSFYVIWTYLVSDFMFGSGTMSGIGQALGWSNAFGSYGAMVDALKIGYGILGTFSFLLVFGGMDKIQGAMSASPSFLGGNVKKGLGSAVSTSTSKASKEHASTIYKGSKTLASTPVNFIP